jgi:hypothetical protein
MACIHRFLGADGLHDRVGAEPARELLDLRDTRLAALLDDVGGTELLGQRLTVGVPAEAMIRSAPSCCAARIPNRPTAPSPTTATVFARGRSPRRCLWSSTFLGVSQDVAG